MLDVRDTIMSKSCLQDTLGPVRKSEVTTPKSHYHKMNASVPIGTKYSSVTKIKDTLGGITESFREQTAEISLGSAGISKMEGFQEGPSTEEKPVVARYSQGIGSIRTIYKAS